MVPEPWGVGFFSLGGIWEGIGDVPANPESDPFLGTNEPVGGQWCLSHPACCNTETTLQTSGPVQSSRPTLGGDAGSGSAPGDSETLETNLRK